MKVHGIANHAVETTGRRPIVIFAATVTPAWLHIVPLCGLAFVHS